MRKIPILQVALVTCFLSTATGRAVAEIDLRNAEVQRLDNGLTLILLEDRNFPVASTQMLYRVGARNESYGRTGIAHFLEHMAFRASESFPDTGLASSIYAVGGEWHGYTWTDETTYFSTVPKEHLDLLLRIEADRMSRLEISRDDMEAERGAVLAEMHMYENYPTSMLIDSIMYAAFTGHPYRNNTIGWESDIEKLTHEEVVGFYKKYYQPANAVLAVVGDFDTRKTSARIEELFGGTAGRPPAPLPRTVEPEQRGERRVRLYGHVDDKRFTIGYHAPSANDADFAAFLVLQEIVGSGSGVNFRQNDWGTPVDEGSLLHGLAAGVTTWFPPSAQDYIFTIGGTIPADGDEKALEDALEERLAALRRTPPDADVVAAAIADVLDDLAFDVQTTEDAAHQLAFFEGLGALDVLLELPERISAVTAADVQRVAQRHLQAWQRTIGWYVPDDGIVTAPADSAEQPDKSVPAGPAVPVDRVPVPLPVVRKLRGGIPAIVQSSDASPTASLEVILRGNDFSGLAADRPVLGFSSLTSRFRPDALQESVRAARVAVDALTHGAGGRELSSDPETRLEQTLTGIMSGGASLSPGADTPVLLVLSGDVDVDEAFRVLNAQLGELRVGKTAPTSAHFDGDDVDVHLGVAVAQAQLGYVAPAPGPLDKDALASRILLYILSHDYEGRLGKEAISKRGLAYYIDARYRSDGHNGWITLEVGVDPGKLAPLRDLMETELQRLREEPPTIEEIEEAKRHFLGRARSAAQSNDELSSALAEQWLWYGDTQTPKALDRRLGRISRQDVLDAIPAFVQGAVVSVSR